MDQVTRLGAITFRQQGITKVTADQNHSCIIASIGNNGLKHVLVSCELLLQQWDTKNKHNIHTISNKRIRQMIQKMWEKISKHGSITWCHYVRIQGRILRLHLRFLFGDFITLGACVLHFRTELLDKLVTLQNLRIQCFECIFTTSSALLLRSGGQKWKDTCKERVECYETKTHKKILWIKNEMWLKKLSIFTKIIIKHRTVMSNAISLDDKIVSILKYPEHSTYWRN